jgi:hypothetical protein
MNVGVCLMFVLESYCICLFYQSYFKVNFTLIFKSE